MENHQGRMETTEKVGAKKSKAVKNRGSSRLNIIVMGDMGRVRSFKVSPRLLICLAVFLVVYLPVSVFLASRITS